MIQNFRNRRSVPKGAQNTGSKLTSFGYPMHNKGIFVNNAYKIS